MSGRGHSGSSWARPRNVVEPLEARYLLSTTSVERFVSIFLSQKDNNRGIERAESHRQLPGTATQAAVHAAPLPNISHPAKTAKAKPAAKPKPAPKPKPAAKPKPAPKPKPVTSKPKPTKPTVSSTSSSADDSFQPDGQSASVVLGQQPGAQNYTRIHGDAASSGDDQVETVLTPANVASSFGEVWESPKLDGAVYATPLFLDSLGISGNVATSPGSAPGTASNGIQNASYVGKSLGIVFAATGGGTVYAIAAQDTNGVSGIAPGTIVWQEHLGGAYSGIDGNSIGVLSTPVIDLASGRLYVCGSVTYNGQSDFWVFALSLHDGSIIPGWPVEYTQNQLDVLNQNQANGVNETLSGVTLTSGSTNVTCASTTGLKTGETITGTNVPSGATITAISSGTAFTISASATGAASGAYTAFIAVPFSESGADQRGGLNLSPSGNTLYVDYACYGASNPGWLTDVATGITNGAANGQSAAIVSSFSSVDTTAANANGGMWGAGGPVLDANGDVFVSTGDSPGGTGNPPGDWGNSVLEFGPGQTLTLSGVYTPWNYPTQDTIDSDLGGGSPILLNLPTGSSTTTELLAVGGKQGNGYLVDAGNQLNNPTPNANNSPASYPASLTARPPGNETPDQDPSLYNTTPTGTQTYWVSPNGPQDGPLALFLPYNESSASGDTAKARDTPATFVDAAGNHYVIFAGTTKAGVGSTTPLAPSLIVTEVMHSAGQPAYLQVVSKNTTVMSNPGSNQITSNGTFNGTSDDTSNEIDWVVDSGVLRTSGMTNFANGDPVLYAFNALTMQPLWSSAYQQLDMPSGKYNSIAVASGNVFVGTDRIQAFGLTNTTIVDDSVQGTGMNQFNYVGSGWTHITGDSTMSTFDATLSTDNVQGDYASLTFTGSQIQIYADEDAYGTDTIQLDGGNTQTFNLSATPTSPNGDGEGDILIDTISGLSAGTHSLKILNNAASNTIDIDKVVITPPTGAPAQLGVSATDGNAIPTGSGSVISYTLSYNNAGTMGYTTVGSPVVTAPASGTNATGVTLTETVPANTTADLANSTAGWTLQTAGAGGAGSAGSTYACTVGSLNAGVTGSAVFAVDLNNMIPANTPYVYDSFSIQDSAGDTATSTRQTPIPPAAEAQLRFNQEPPTTGGTGIPLSPAIQVSTYDQFDNPYQADSSSTVTLTLSSGTFSGGGNTATAVASNGVATFSNLQISAPGTYTLTASDGALSTTVSSPISISDTSKLGIIQQPMQTAAGATINPAVTVGVYTIENAIDTTNTSTVTLTLSNGGLFADGSTTETAQAVSGVATFNNLVIDATGSYTLFATDGSLTGAQTNSFNVVAQATHLVFTQQPDNTLAGEAVNPSVAVSLEDQFGNVATGNTSNVTLTLSSGSFFGGATSVTAAALNGVALFNDLVLSAAGNYTVTATDPTLTSATSNTFNIQTPGSGNPTLTSIDDNNANNTGSTPQVVYSSANWAQSPTSLANNYDGTITTDSTIGDTATVTFTGSLITFYAALSTTPGASADIFLDGNFEGNVNLSATTPAIAPVYTSPLLTSSTAPGAAPGTHTLVVKVTGTVSIDKFVLGPATPTIAWANPVSITYGTALTGTQLDAFVSNAAGFGGTFTYSPVLGTLLSAGANQPLLATFKPTDQTDYLTATAEQFLTVNQTTPLITWNGPDLDLTYGQGLTQGTDTSTTTYQLDATATALYNGNTITVPGTFVYTPGAGFVPPAGQDYPLSLTFTPTDTADYTSETAINNVDVDPATPIINWPNPADIQDGTALSATQLNASNAGTNIISGTTVPGTFTYSPPLGTVLPAGQQQPIGVVFTPTNLTEYSVVGQTDYINVDAGPAAKLAFVQQPTPIKSGGTISPAVTVAVEDSVGSTLTSNTSTVTLTLNGGTFSGGGTTATATAVNGVATFPSLTIPNNGIYTLTATDGSLTSALSNQFSVGTSVYVNFNNAATDLTTNFAQNLAGTVGGADFTWGSTDGVDDQTGGKPGGGVDTTAAADQTSIYTPATVDLADGNVHTISEFVTASSGGLGTGNKILQLGFNTSATGAFNANYSFISARVYGDFHAEFQSCNGAGQAAVSIDTTAAPTGVQPGDWLQLILTTQETASGSFTGTFSLEDYGQTGTLAGVGTPKVIIAPVPYTVSGLTTIGTGAAMYAGWRNSGVMGTSQYPLEYDNFAVDQTPQHLAYLAQPTVTTAGVPFSTPFVVAVEDINGNVVAGDSSTVTLKTNTGVPFSNGSTTISAVAVNGIATFNNVTLNAAGGLIIIATDSNQSLDLAFAPVTINGSSKLAFAQQPPTTAVTAGAAITPAVAVAVQDMNGVTVPADTSTVTLTLSSGTFANTGTNTMSVAAVNGVATFTGMVIDTAGNYTLTASDGALAGAASNSFTVAAGPVKLAFTQQPVNTAAGSAIAPAVTVAIQDVNGNVVSGNASTVTLTLTGGTFSGGGTTATAAASAGVATFSNLVIAAVGAYTLTASDGTLASAASNPFAVVNAASTIFDNFNTAATDLTSKFSVTSQPTFTNNLSWASTAGIADQTGPTAGGGIKTIVGSADETAVYTPSTVNLSDGAVHTISQYVTWSTALAAGDKPLQLGFLAPGSTAFNSAGTNSFISARIIGNSSAEVQSANNGAAASVDNTTFTAPANGDWLQLVFTVQETASGSYSGAFSVLDYGKTAAVGTVAVASQPKILLAPVSYAVTGLTALGTGAGASAGFRIATTAAGVSLDNFSVDPATTTIDDRTTGTGANQVNYSTGWATSTLASAYSTTLTSDATTGGTATVSFTGTQIRYYAVVKSTNGVANVTIDGGATNTVNEYNASTTGIGNVLVYSSPVLTPGTHTLVITVSGTAGTGGGKGVTVDRFDIIKATPIVTWPTPATINYGTALGATQLDATASVAGTFVYSPPSGSILGIGTNQALNVAFVPTDTADYGTNAASTQISVASVTPAVTAVSPSSGPTAGGTAVVITGTNFTGTSAVTFGGIPATSFIINSPTQITAVDPAGTAGIANVLVTAPGGTSTVSTSDQFTYVAPPTVVSVTPEDSAGNGVAAGSAAKGQRSMEAQIAVVFSEPVNLTAGAFTLNLVNNYGGGENNAAADSAITGVLGTPTNPSGDGVTWIIPILSTGTVSDPTSTLNGTSVSYALKGTHGGISGASLNNGVYDLDVTAADVTATGGGPAMAANFVSAAWHRLYGDIDNARRVFNTEYSAFLAAYTSTYVSNGATNYNQDLDVDGDGRVFNTDYSAFLAEFGSTRIYSEPQS
jgi:hypothetical protein